MAAAATSGFFVVRWLASRRAGRTAARARTCCAVRSAGARDPQLWRQKFDPSHPNVYRGWFPAADRISDSKEGIDLGPDVAYGASLVRCDDPLREATPLPPEAGAAGLARIGGRATIRDGERSQALMRSIARSLTLAENFFDHAFDQGLSTLRLLRYPLRDRPGASCPVAIRACGWMHQGGGIT